MVLRRDYFALPAAFLRMFLHNVAWHGLQQRVIQRVTEIRNRISITRFISGKDHSMLRRLQQSSSPVLQQVSYIHQYRQSALSISLRINRHSRPLPLRRQDFQAWLTGKLEQAGDTPIIAVRSGADVNFIVRGSVVGRVVQQAEDCSSWAAGEVVARCEPVWWEGEGDREVSEDSLAEGVAGCLEGFDGGEVLAEEGGEGLVVFSCRWVREAHVESSLR